MRPAEPSVIALPEDPPAFVRETRMLPLEAPSGVRIDVAFAMLPYEEEAIRRAVVREIGGARVRVCTPEDLVLYKIVSDRPRDLDDVRGILRRMGRELDRGYLDPRVERLAEATEESEVAERYSRLLSEEGLET